MTFRKKIFNWKAIISLCITVFFVCVCAYVFSRIPSVPSGDVPRTALTSLVSTSTTVAEQGGKIREIPTDYKLLGRAEISFKGSTVGRAKNIELGVSQLDGTEIFPGEEFSFIKALGPVTADLGYSEERVFLNGEVQKGIGGGLCQVSTTLFNTALQAGLPITERHSHSFAVSLYDYGMDATYSDPGVDLKFVNDMATPIIIKGTTVDQKVLFEMYGVSDGRIASTTQPIVSNIVDVPGIKYVATTTRAKSEPECVNTPQIGYTIRIIYNVFYRSGEHTEQNFISTYKPLSRICYVIGTTTIQVR